MDRILIKDLLVRCRVGVTAEERREKQDVMINLVLLGDLSQAGRSDRIEDTVDYRALKKRVLAMVEKSEYCLIEALADRVAALCLATPGVEEVQATIEKPSALRFARSVGIEITRRAKDVKPVTVYLSVGSNIDPEENILKAIALLKSHLRIQAVSRFYRTKPIGKIDAPPFINGVVKAETRLLPLDLKYAVLREIEEKLGRVRTEDKNAPRTIDLDMLLYGDLVIKQDDLVVPDPEIAEREFLAVPLSELFPERYSELARKFKAGSMKLLEDYSAKAKREALR